MFFTSTCTIIEQQTYQKRCSIDALFIVLLALSCFFNSNTSFFTMAFSTSKHHHHHRHHHHGSASIMTCPLTASTIYDSINLSSSLSLLKYSKTNNNDDHDADEEKHTTTTTPRSRKQEEAESLMERVKQLRTEIGQLEEEKQINSNNGNSNSNSNINSNVGTTGINDVKNDQTIVTSPWSVIDTITSNGDENNENETIDGQGYRFYVDIGREEGTWMDRRWGASGKRIQFTVDVKFLMHHPLTNMTIANQMVKDNYMGKSSPVYTLLSAPLSRLRDGFDQMKCHTVGAYRLDVVAGNSNQCTMRCLITVDGINNGIIEQAGGGTTDAIGHDTSSSYGDISIPKGNLYFSLPCFGTSIKQLSRKEGPVTVRQIGWNTGWRREESRIVGTFHVRPIDEARRKDGY